MEVLAGGPWVWWQEEIFLADTIRCWWGWIIIINLVCHTHPSRELKGGLYLSGQPLDITHIWNHLQLPPPIWGIYHLSPPFHQFLILLHWGFCQEMVSCVLLILTSQSMEELLHIRPQCWWGPQVEFSLFMPPVAEGYVMVSWQGCSPVKPGSAFGFVLGTSSSIGPDFGMGCRLPDSP